MRNWTSDERDDFNEGYGADQQYTDYYAPLEACQGFFRHLLDTGWMPLDANARAGLDTSDPAWRDAYAHLLAGKCQALMAGGYDRHRNMRYVRPNTVIDINGTAVPSIDFFYRDDRT